MVKLQPSKLVTRVRFPSPALSCKIVLFRHFYTFLKPPAKVISSACRDGASPRLKGLAKAEAAKVISSEPKASREICLFNRFLHFVRFAPYGRNDKFSTGQPFYEIPGFGLVVAKFIASCGKWAEGLLKNSRLLRLYAPRNDTKCDSSVIARSAKQAVAISNLSSGGRGGQQPRRPLKK